MRKRKVQIQETIGDPKKTTMESAEPSEQSVMNARKLRGQPQRCAEFVKVLGIFPVSIRGANAPLFYRSPLGRPWGNVKRSLIGPTSPAPGAGEVEM